MKPAQASAGSHAATVGAKSFDAYAVAEIHQRGSMKRRIEIQLGRIDLRLRIDLHALTDQKIELTLRGIVIADETAVPLQTFPELQRKRSAGICRLADTEGIAAPFPRGIQRDGGISAECDRSALGSERRNGIATQKDVVCARSAGI